HQLLLVGWLLRHHVAPQKKGREFWIPPAHLVIDSPTNQAGFGRLLFVVYPSRVYRVYLLESFTNRFHSSTYRNHSLRHLKSESIRLKSENQSSTPQAFICARTNQNSRTSHEPVRASLEHSLHPGTGRKPLWKL